MAGQQIVQTVLIVQIGAIQRGKCVRIDRRGWPHPAGSGSGLYAMLRGDGIRRLDEHPLARIRHPYAPRVHEVHAKQHVVRRKTPVADDQWNMTVRARAKRQIEAVLVVLNAFACTPMLTCCGACASATGCTPAANATLFVTTVRVAPVSSTARA